MVTIERTGEYYTIRSGKRVIKSAIGSTELDEWLTSTIEKAVEGLNKGRALVMDLKVHK